MYRKRNVRPLFLPLHFFPKQSGTRGLTFKKTKARSTFPRLSVVSLEGAFESTTLNDTLVHKTSRADWKGPCIHLTAFNKKITPISARRLLIFRTTRCNYRSLLSRYYRDESKCDNVYPSRARANVLTRRASHGDFFRTFSDYVQIVNTLFRRLSIGG